MSEEAAIAIMIFWSMFFSALMLFMAFMGGKR